MEAAPTLPQVTVTGGDVVCKEVGEGDLTELACSIVGWCTGRQCITSGDYTPGDVMYKVCYEGVSLQRVGQIGQGAFADSIPRDSTLSLLSLDEGVDSEAFRVAGKKLIVRSDYSSRDATHLQSDLRDPTTGRSRRVFGNVDYSVLPPSEGVMPLSSQSRFERYHQGSVFRSGTHSVCMLAGRLGSDSRDFAACYETSRICKFHPELCASTPAAGEKEGGVKGSATAS